MTSDQASAWIVGMGTVCLCIMMIALSVLAVVYAVDTVIDMKQKWLSERTKPKDPKQ